MEKCDLILSVLWNKVGKYQHPEDHPTPSLEVARGLQLTLERVLSLSEEMAEEGFLKISPLFHPPLLYLTLTGLSRARRLALTA